MSWSTTLIVILICLAIAVAGAIDTVKAREHRAEQQREDRS